MASRIPRSCVIASCARPAVVRGRCLDHSAQLDAELSRADFERYKRDDPMRPNYFLTRWRELRDVVLSEEPLCRECAAHGRTTPAEDVDHIVRARTLPEMGLFWDRANLQPLCKSCHSRKTAHEVGFVKAGAR